MASAPSFVRPCSLVSVIGLQEVPTSLRDVLFRDRSAFPSKPDAEPAAFGHTQG